MSAEVLGDYFCVIGVDPTFTACKDDDGDRGFPGDDEVAAEDASLDVWRRAITNLAIIPKGYDVPPGYEAVCGFDDADTPFVITGLYGNWSKIYTVLCVERGGVVQKITADGSIDTSEAPDLNDLDVRPSEASQQDDVHDATARYCWEGSDAPVTDVCVTYLHKGEQVPEGFEVVKVFGYDTDPGKHSMAGGASVSSPLEFLKTAKGNVAISFRRLDLSGAICFQQRPVVTDIKIETIIAPIASLWNERGASAKMNEDIKQHYVGKKKSEKEKKETAGSLTSYSGWKTRFQQATLDSKSNASTVDGMTSYVSSLPLSLPSFRYSFLSSSPCVLSLVGFLPSVVSLLPFLTSIHPSLQGTSRRSAAPLARTRVSPAKGGTSA
jgi:hypothetical protein